jgi:hypothetical protein
MTTPTPRPPHTVLAGLLCLLAALAAGPLLDAPAPATGLAPLAADALPEGDGHGGARVELSAAGFIAGGHGAAALLAVPAPSPSRAGDAWLPAPPPVVSPRVLTRPFDRLSYRTTGPPLRG